MPDLNNKVSLITGAGSGIGAATAVHFAVSGSSVALNDINAPSLQETVENCVKAGLARDQILCVPGDVSSSSDRENMVNKTVDHFGKLDVLVNCAGIFIDANVSDPDYLAKLEKLLDTNFKSVYQMIYLAVPHLKKTKGNIINVSSWIAGRTGPNMSAYSISKSGVNQVTRALAGDLGSFQIRVNSVNPGTVRTNIVHDLGVAVKNMDLFWETYGSVSALRRVAEPHEIAKPIAFLASEEASFITGTNILVDGGISVNFVPGIE